MSPVQQSQAQAVAAWLRVRGAQRLVSDSRQAKPGDAFVAWPGFVADGRAYVSQALRSGAVAALVEAEGAERFDFDVQRVLPVAGLKAHAGDVAHEFEGQPSSRLNVVAVTGTNGKTSTAWWTAQALAEVGAPCGLIGTLGVGQPGELVQTGLTTPDPLTFQAALRRFVDAGMVACAIEASSIGLVEHRLAGTRIAVAQFTNFTQDHLDFHGSMQAYWRAKAMLFDWPGLQAAVINVDDDKGRELAARLRDRPGLRLLTYSVGHQPADLLVVNVRHEEAGLGFTVTERGLEHTVHTQLVGDFNLSNLLAVVGALRCLGFGLAQSVDALQRLTPVPGRMQVVRQPTTGVQGQPLAVVDYAHTPDALEKALSALRPLAAARGGLLRVVFGCGGDRDRSKRPLMGAVAARLADDVWITSDNPRSEEPQAIIDQVLAGALPAGRLVRCEVNREQAIHQALAASSQVADVVLIAGKGHETYQEIDGQKLPFSDVQKALAALMAWRALHASNGAAA